MASSLDGVPGKLIVDSIHGDIHLYDHEWRILDTMAFQRLRGLKQLQMGQVTYPNATHTRFAHSLGTLAVMARILIVAKKSKALGLKRRQVENLRMAALLHDIGHYPYSHLMEGLDRVEITEEVVQAKVGEDKQPRSVDLSEAGYPKHELIGREIVTHQGDLIKAVGGLKRAKEIADLFTRSGAADPQLSKLVHSSFDMDRLDYLQRDSQAAGLPYGHIDVNYLLNCLHISPTGMVGVLEKALPAAEQFLLARFFMHKAVYFHKTTYGMEEACRQLLRRMRDAGSFDVPRTAAEILDIVRTEKLAGFTDSWVDQLVHRAAQAGDHVMKTLARSIESRRPPKLLKEVQVFTAAEHNPGATFWKTAKAKLTRIAEKYGIPLGQFLMCQSKPLKLEQRGSFLTNEQARNLPSEEEDELIKVFIGQDPEPKSLVDVPHSLLNICAGRHWQAFRLYVILDNPDDTSTIQALRDEVRNWDSP